MRNKKKFVLIPIAVVAFIAVKSAAVLFLWNALIPDLFHGPEITYLQALGLMVLAKLFVGFGGRPGVGRFGRGKWRRHMGEHLENLTPEEREKLRERFAGGKSC